MPDPWGSTYTCDICGQKGFRTYQAMLEHKRQKHGWPGKRG